MPAEPGYVRRRAGLRVSALSPHGQQALRRSAAIIFSTIVHIGLIWLMANRLTPSEDLPARIQAPGATSLTTVQLAELSSPEIKTRAPSSQVARPDPAVVSSELDSTPAPHPFPLEWRVARMTVALPPAEPAVSASSPAQTGPAGRSGNSGNSGQWDPFAGAAPLPAREARDLHPPTAPVVGPSVVGRHALNLDLRVIEEARQKVLRELPTARGSARFEVRLSADGVVVEANAAGGDAEARALAAFRKAIIGQRLVRPVRLEAPTRTVALPLVTFG